jgi:hypothetical protein
MDNLSNALRQVQLCLRDVKEPWLVGGSCGLLLQGVPLQATPRDLDLYTDSQEAALIHQALSDYSIDAQIEDESGIYKSVLSHYEVCGIRVELVGGFEVAALNSLYKVEAAFLAKSNLLEIDLPVRDNEGSMAAVPVPALKLMPLEHELLFNLMRSRPDRYEAIAPVMRSRHVGLTKTMSELIQRNTLDEALIFLIMQLLHIKVVQ